ncbi:MAG: phage terminase large subunit [Chloroflexales bacterium]|nr:phage terminase large subunit [Chloroflexales bacterium]
MAAAAATTQQHLLDALRERARRERQRRRSEKIRAPPLQDWLKEVSPKFTWDWPHLVYIQQQLDRVTSGEIRKLMLFMPPRHGKSELTTIRYPIFRMERDPSLRVMLGCYNQDLANLFSRQARRIAVARGIVGGGINAQDEWEISGGGSFRAASIGGGGITGRGANLIIIDDPIRSREDADSPTFREKAWDWYSNDVRTRLEPGGAIILILTRWHQDDLAGRILASEDGLNWTVCSLPAEAEAGDPLGREVGAALCPERFDIAELHNIKSTMGIDYFALYQQRPVAEEGGLYQRAWFRYEHAPRTAEGDLDVEAIIQAWDTASSELGDYSVCVTAGVKDNRAYVLDVYRARLETPELLRQIKNLAERWQPTVLLVEDASNGIAVTQMLKRETRLPIIGVPPMRGGKLAQAKANLPYLEGGRVSFCPGAYLPEFERELLAFPAVAHDDQVDALNIALTRIFAAAVQRKATSHSGSPARAR